MFQVWYCTSSRSHTTVAKYAEYIATSFKEAKERLGDKFSINPKVTITEFIKYQINIRICFVHYPDPRIFSQETDFGPFFNFPPIY